MHCVLARGLSTQVRTSGPNWNTAEFLEFAEGPREHCLWTANRELTHQRTRLRKGKILTYLEKNCLLCIPMQVECVMESMSWILYEAVSMRGPSGGRYQIHASHCESTKDLPCRK